MGRRDGVANFERRTLKKQNLNREGAKGRDGVAEKRFWILNFEWKRKRKRKRLEPPRRAEEDYGAVWIDV